MSTLAGQAALIAVNLLAASVWTGGLLAIAVVARVTRRTLDPPARIALFRALGRAYAIIGGVSLAVALGTGAALLPEPPATPAGQAAFAVAASLVTATAAGVRQARSMTRLRSRALADPSNGELTARVGRAAAVAASLRATIALLTLALLCLAAILAS